MMPGTSLGGLTSCASICFKGTSKRTPAQRRLWRVMATMSPEMSLPKMVGSAGSGLTLIAFFMAFHGAGSKSWKFSKANWRVAPGGIPCSICAASARMVPEPHIGSNSTMPGFQPDTRSRPAARFSRSGASPVSSRQPRLNRASPEVSRYTVNVCASRKPTMRMSGVLVLTDGRSLNWSRKRSQIASLIFRVVNSRLRSGDFTAVTSTRIVWCTPNQSSQDCARVRS